MARRSSYVRDSNGRFASTPGGSSSRSKKPKATGGTLAARAQLKASRAKLTPGGRKQQQGAVTRASNRLKASKLDNRKKLSVLASPQNTIRKGGEMARVAAFSKRKAALKNQQPTKQVAQAAPAQAPAAKQSAPKKKVGKAPFNMAKAKYRIAKSMAREARMVSAGKTNPSVKKAEERVAKMEKNRKSSRSKLPKF